MSRPTLPVPPNQIEAERALLGAVLQGGRDAIEALSLLRAEDFYQDKHRLVFAAVQRLLPGVVDLITVGAALRKAGSYDEAGGAPFLANLTEWAQWGRGPEAHAALIAQSGRQRRVRQALLTGLDRMQEATTDTELLAVAQAVQEAAGEQTEQGFADVHWLGDVAVEQIANLRARTTATAPGGTWGFAGMDRITPGLEARGLYILAGRPGMGKTAVALEVCRRNAKARMSPWLFVTYEMAIQVLAERQIAAYGKVALSRLRRNDLGSIEWVRAENAAAELQGIPLAVTADCVTVEDICRRARWLRQKHGGLGGVCVDYLQLMGGSRRPNSSRQEEVAATSRALKQMARELECPVIALSQLNRAVEVRPEKRPILSDLRESGALEQDAEIVGLLYRDDYYARPEQSSEQKPPAPTSVVEVGIAKNRNGPTGTVYLAWHREWGEWTDAERQAETKAEAAHAPRRPQTPYRKPKRWDEGE